MKKEYILIFLVFSFCDFFSQTVNNEKYFNISIKDYKESLKFLGSDSLQGRETGSQGAELTASYLAKKLSEYGLKPAVNNNYFQNLPIHESVPLTSSKLILYYGNEEIKLNYGEDYFIFKPGEQTFIPAPLPMVFVGYGIVAPEFDYNDYQSVDVEGKIVVMLSGEPQSTDENYFSGKIPTLYSYPEAKQRIAISRGASGCIIIPNPNNQLYKPWEEYKKQFYFEDMTLAYSVSSNLNLLLNPDSADLLFNGSGYSLKQIFQMSIQNSIRSFPLKNKLTFEGEFKEKDFISSNVAGILEGSDEKLKDQYLIVSAHYDHLGIGPAVNGDSIYNGVSDNAVGTAAALEMARSLSLLKDKPRRSILFLFLTGEEKGLLGSSYYDDHPIVPLYKTVANINVDGVSMFDRIKSIIGIGDEFSTLENFLQATAKKFNLTLTNIPAQFEQHESFFLSDQIAFAQAGIPSLLLMEGGDYENMNHDQGLQNLINYSENIYHTPFDDLSQKINYDAVEQFIEILDDLTLRISNSDETPEWNENSPFKNIRLKTIAEKR